MNRRKALIGLATGSVATAGVSYAQSNSAAGASNATLSALLINAATGAIVGSFDIKRFAAIDNQLQAIGTVTVTDGVKTVVSTLALPVTSITQSAAQQQASCPILHLAIGPINLNLLGLVITTQPIVIDIVAVPGPGNLLGNLLCAIAGLLNPGGTLQGILNQLVALLNQLLGSL